MKNVHDMVIKENLKSVNNVELIKERKKALKIFDTYLLIRLLNI